MRYAIIGNDILAYLCAVLAKRRGHEVCVFSGVGSEPKGLPIQVFRNPLFEELLRRWDVSFTDYRIKSGVLLKENVYSWPNDIRSISVDYSQEVRAAIWCKTRMVSEAPVQRAVDYEWSVDSSMGIQLDWEKLRTEIVKMAMRIPVCKAPIEGVFDTAIKAGYDEWIFDRALVTCPQWDLEDKTTWRTSYMVAIAIHRFKLKSHSQEDPFAQWDYVWTPHTPENVVQRFWQSGNFNYVDFGGDPEHVQDGLIADLSWLFPDGWNIEDGAMKTINGYLCEPDFETEWPSTVIPIGRLSEWDAKAHFSAAVAKALELIG